MARPFDTVLSMWRAEYRKTVGRDWRSADYPDPSAVASNAPEGLISKIKVCEAEQRQLEILTELHSFRQPGGVVAPPPEKKGLMEEFEVQKKEVERWTELPTPQD